MKILLTGWGFPPKIDGGLDIHVKHLFEELEERSLEVTLALPEDNAPDRENVIGLSTGGEDMIRQARKMSAEVAGIAEEYDILHTHDWFGAESGFKAKKYSDITWVSTIHSLSSSRNRFGGGRIEELEKAAIKEPDEVIAVSKKLADDIENRYSRSIRVVYNGFSTPEINGRDIKEELQIEEDMILFVGRHAEQKGLEHLLYGFKKFLGKNEAALVIGGEGHMTEVLKEFSEILGISENVFFTGFIPDEQLGDYYSSADIFISPSINEPFGLTITEAIESGTTVVATESGAEEVIDGENIVNIEPDSDSIASGLERGLEKKFNENYARRTWQDVVDETLEIYERLL